MKKMNVIDLVSNIRSSGIERGDLVLVHSALGSIGPVEGGASTVIDAFLDVIGPSGSLVMPTMTSPFETFDPVLSKSNVGVLTETMRLRSDAVRSLYPVHSVAAIGKLAEEICRDHDKCNSGCGSGSPFEKIWKYDGKIMLLGVDQDRNTILHAFETERKVSYFMHFTIPAPNYAPYNGTGIFELNDFPEGHRNFIGITSELRENGLIRYGRIGKAVTQVMQARAIHDFLIPKLQKDPYYFLCKNPNCDFCARAREGQQM